MFLVFARAGSVPCRSCCSDVLCCSAAGERSGSHASPWQRDRQMSVLLRVSSEPGRLYLGWKLLGCHNNSTRENQTFLIYVCRNISKQNALRESVFLMDGDSSLQYSLTLAYDSYLIYFVFRQSSHSTTPSCLLNQHQPDQERPLTNPFLQILSHFQMQPYLNSFSLFIS